MSRARLRAVLLAAVVSQTVACVSGDFQFTHLSERQYYRMYEQFMPITVTPVRHVKERVWGTYFMGIQLREPNVRAVFEKALAENPNYYVSDVNVYTDISGAFFLVGIIVGMPVATVEFDIVEVRPWAATQPDDSAPPASG